MKCIIIYLIPLSHRMAPRMITAACRELHGGGRGEPCGQIEWSVASNRQISRLPARGCLDDMATLPLLLASLLIIELALLASQDSGLLLRAFLLLSWSNLPWNGLPSDDASLGVLLLPWATAFGESACRHRARVLAGNTSDTRSGLPLLSSVGRGHGRKSLAFPRPSGQMVLPGLACIGAMGDETFRPSERRHSGQLGRSESRHRSSASESMACFTEIRQQSAKYVGERARRPLQL